MSHEGHRNLLVAAALAGFDDLALAEFRMKDSLSWFVRHGEHFGHGCGGARTTNLVTKTACRPRAKGAAAAKTAQEMVRDRLQEPGGNGIAEPAVGGTRAGVSQIEQPLGASHPNIKETALLFHLLRVEVLALDSAADRQQPFLDTRDEDDRKLQALRRVEGDQGDAAALVGVKTIDVGNEGDTLQIRS